MTSAAATGEADSGAFAIGTDSYIEITGDSTANSSGGFAGAIAVSGAHISVGGDVEGRYIGAEASGAGSLVEVLGEVRVAGGAGYGVFANNGGAVNAVGDVDASGNYYGVSSQGGTVLVGGNVTSGFVGAWYMTTAWRPSRAQ